jgi:Polyketide cyclase / dehydrase and lipid transport
MGDTPMGQTRINESAPVVGWSEIEIGAPPEVAWNVLTAIGRWPDWNPAVKSVGFEEGIDIGSEFRWKAGPGTIWSTIQDVDAPRRIVWTGESFGVRAIHVHTFKPHAGGTLVRTEESYDGLVARIFRRRLKNTLDTTLDDELRHLKAEAERRGPRT